MTYPQFSLSGFCRLFGVTRQSFYQHFKAGELKEYSHEMILHQVSIIREEHPRIGARKLLVIMQPFFMENQITIGRDAFFDLLAQNKMLVKRRARQVQTTFSKHWLRKWPNLIKNFEVDTINHLWVSDITYWKVNNKNYYISLITDVRSRKIIGYSLDNNLKAQSTLEALNMAICYKPQNAQHIIHHSDRGSQYCSSEYVAKLLENNIKISMTESGEPTDNAYAERVNGILKEEYLYQYHPKNISQAKAVLAHTIQLYNQKRPHLSIENQTPNMAFKSNSRKFTRLWKSYAKTNCVNP
jgi:transposase InsO family protein